MKIDYSKTVSLFTNQNACPFQNMQELLKNASESDFFSKIDVKSAYYQVPLKKEDRQFAAFEVLGKLYKTNGLPFGITNAIPAFQRIIDNFVDQNKLKGGILH